MMSYLQNGDTHFCCGCRACVQKCPQQCISLKEKDGFFYPAIDQTRCIHCKLCEKVCQYTDENQDRRKERTVIKTYSVWHKDENELPNSTSGGVFFALAEQFVKDGGVVFGAGYTQDFSVKLFSASTAEECQAFRKSKYVFSSTDASYPQAEHLLKEGHKVLFFGTPCQIMGLYSYLGKEYENLFTVDIVCHGFNAPISLQSYLDMMEKKYKGKITALDFRHKTKGKAEPELRIAFSNGQLHTEPYRTSSFGKLYGSNALLMDSCTTCQYANTSRPGDLTIGDFWGIDQHCPQAYNADGTSLILVNSEKGNVLFESIKENVIAHEAELSWAVAHNQPLGRPSPKNPFSKKVISSLKEKGFEKTYHHYQMFDSKFFLVYRVFRKLVK